jgi:hypothetical protein
MFPEKKKFLSTKWLTAHAGLEIQKWSWYNNRLLYTVITQITFNSVTLCYSNSEIDCFMLYGMRLWFQEKNLYFNEEKLPCFLCFRVYIILLSLVFHTVFKPITNLHKKQLLMFVIFSLIPINNEHCDSTICLPRNMLQNVHHQWLTSQTQHVGCVSFYYSI